MKPRLIRRATTHCPADGKPVVVDLLLGRTGHPEAVLRCSGRPECPPTCDGACSHSPESVTGPAVAVVICPPGKGVPEDID